MNGVLTLAIKPHIDHALVQTPTCPTVTGPSPALPDGSALPVPSTDHRQTDCLGLAHWADWTVHGWHPRTLKEADLSPWLVEHMRGTDVAECDAAEALRTAALLFGPGDQGYEGDATESGDAGGEASGLDTTPVGNVRGSDRSEGIRMQGMTRKLLRQDGVPEGGGTVQGAEQGERDKKSNNGNAGNGAGGDSGRSSNDDGAGSDKEWQAVVGLEHMVDTDWVQESGYQPLGQECPLFARKFPGEGRGAALRMALSCRGLGLGAWCEHNQHLTAEVLQDL